MPYRLDRKRWNRGIDDPELTRLHAEGKTDAQIATEMEFHVDTATKNRVRLKLSINRPARKQRPRVAVEKPPAAPKPPVVPGWDFSRDNLDLPGGHFAK